MKWTSTVIRCVQSTARADCYFIRFIIVPFSRTTIKYACSPRETTTLALGHPYKRWTASERVRARARTLESARMQCSWRGHTAQTLGSPSILLFFALCLSCTSSGFDFCSQYLTECVRCTIAYQNYINMRCIFCVSFFRISKRHCTRWTRAHWQAFLIYCRITEYSFDHQYISIWPLFFRIVFAPLMRARVFVLDSIWYEVLLSDVSFAKLQLSSLRQQRGISGRDEK